MQFLDLAGVKKFKQYVDENFTPVEDHENAEKVAAAALNNLNDRISNIEDGDWVTAEDYSAIEDAHLDTYTKQEIDTMLAEIDGGGGNENVIESITFNGTSATIDSNTKTAAINANIENFYFVQGSSSQAGNATSGAYLSTKWEGTIPGVTSVVDGLKIAYRINTNPGVGTAGVVLSIDGTNYYPVVLNVNTKATTHYSVGSTILLVFNSTQTVSGVYLTSNTSTTVTGCWQIADYNTNTDTIGYSIRTNGSTLPAKFKTYRYRLLFTSADGNYWVGANASTSTNATAVRTPTTEKINPFGPIIYYGTTTVVESNINFSASYLWQQYAGIALGYSFNSTGAALTLTPSTPIYLKCAPQTDGSAIIDSTTPYVQSLPNTEDGCIYIFLGIAQTATTIELRLEHPIYYFKDNQILIWTGKEVSAVVTETTVSNWGFTKNAGTITGITMNGVSKGISGVVDLGTVLTSYTETDPTVPAWAKASTKPTYTASEVGALPDTTVIPAAPGTLKTNATTAQTASSGEAMSGTITLHKVAKTGTYSDLIGTPTIPTKVSDLTNDSGFTSNTGTITGITMNGSSKGTSGVVNLGTVLTAHQDISGKANLSGAAFTGAVTGTSSGNTAQFRNITISSSEPTSSQGNNGDIWIVI